MEKESIIQELRSVKASFPDCSSMFCDYKAIKESCELAVQKIEGDDIPGAITTLYDILSDAEVDAMFDRSIFQKTRPLVKIIEVLSKSS